MGAAFALAAVAAAVALVLLELLVVALARRRAPGPRLALCAAPVIGVLLAGAIAGTSAQAIGLVIFCAVALSGLGVLPILTFALVRFRLRATAPHSAANTFEERSGP